MHCRCGDEVIVRRLPSIRCSRPVRAVLRSPARRAEPRRQSAKKSETMARALFMITVSFLAALLPACTAEQVYVTGQGWRRSECAEKLDKVDYDRCMRDADMPYDSYKRQTGSEQKR